MTKERWIIVGIALAAGAATAVYHASRPAERIDVDLIQRLDTAEQRPADPPPREWCVAKEASLGGEPKLAIAVLPSSRLTWKVTVPPGASLRAWIGLEPDAWNGEGDGVLFRIGVSDGSGFRDLLVRQVNPFRVPGDRRVGAGDGGPVGVRGARCEPDPEHECKPARPGKRHAPRQARVGRPGGCHAAVGRRWQIPNGKRATSPLRRPGVAVHARTRS